MARPSPMHRLLQGDVGSGKTAVALAALLAAAQDGRQGAFMVPTEVLAEQHFTLCTPCSATWRAPVGRPAARSRRAPRDRVEDKARAAALERLASGAEERDRHARLVVGGLGFESLGAVVIDEQHRFGVEQRAALRAKGRRAPTCW